MLCTNIARRELPANLAGDAGAVARNANTSLLASRMLSGGVLEKSTSVSNDLGITSIDSPMQCGFQWSVVESPHSEFNEFLSDIEVIAWDDIWAVGILTSTLHWDGIMWSRVPGPLLNSQQLQDVDASASDNVWAVGYYGPPSGGQESVVIHWDGDQWTLIPSPNFGFVTRLEGVAVIAPDDIWAIGNAYTAESHSSLAIHWDGTTWSRVPLATTNGILTAISATSANDIWAVGYSEVPNVVTHIEHWDGIRWNVIPSPNRAMYYNFLWAVDAVSPDDIWAVGDSGEQVGPYGITLTLHWDGAQWGIVYSPSPNIPPRSLYAVSGSNSNDVWAVGFDTEIVGSYYVKSTLALHWNGAYWSRAPTLNPGRIYNRFDGVATLANGEAWAVGHAENDPLIQRYYDICVTPTPATPAATHTRTPTSSVTSIPTSTAIATTTTNTATSTSTSMPTPVSCQLQFQDVERQSTFYTHIRCLVCRGIINGYPCGGASEPCIPPDNYPYYRPNANITRGQIAKIVSNSAGYFEPVTGQTFEDILPNSTFYEYIERLATRDVISGYPCGGPGEPCRPPLNRPYFRPNDNATRGQLSKIVCRAYECAGVPLAQTFEDVPPASTFYLDISRLYALGAIQGYKCGASQSTEPCVPPANRPYFRPGTNVTRSQTAKIVAHLFFPNCYTP